MKVLGIDISTSQIGFCEMDLFNILAFSVDLSKVSSHKKRREIIRENLSMFDPDLVVLESIRLFHYNFINLDSIKRLCGITYLIVDFFDIPVYSVDVRSWKKSIFGKSNVEKDKSICYIYDKYDIISNNDLSDAICLAEFGFHIKNEKSKFKRIE